MRLDVTLLQMEYFNIKNKIAIWLALGCAVHCAVWPLLLIALPVFSSQLDFLHDFEFVLIGMTVLISGLIFYQGYKTYKQWSPILLSMLGLIILIVPHFFELHQAWGVLGALLMVGAQGVHIFLLKQRHQSSQKILALGEEAYIHRKAS